MRQSKKDIATGVFAILFVICGILVWAIVFNDSLDDCTSRGHSVGWCMRAHNLDTGR